VNHDDGGEPLDAEREDGGYYDPRPRRSHRGSTNNVSRDPRMSKLLAWAWGALGAAAVSGIWIGSNNLYQINLTLAADVVWKQEVMRQIIEQKEMNYRQEDHFRAVDKKLDTWEGRNLRGPAEVARVR
jgi:hypothetical protein